MTLKIKLVGGEIERKRLARPKTRRYLAECQAHKTTASPTAPRGYDLLALKTCRFSLPMPVHTPWTGRGRVVRYKKRTRTLCVELLSWPLLSGHHKFAR